MTKYQDVIKAVASEGSQRKAAALLGIGRTTLASILKQGPGRAAALGTGQPCAEIELTAEIVAAFESVKAGNSGVSATARAIGMNQSTFSRKYARWNGAAATPIKQPVAAAPKRAPDRALAQGLAGFKALFSPTQRGHDALTKIIDGELKTRGWIYDSEMRGLAGVDSVSWTNLRRDYETLLVEVKDPETHTRKWVWCHPDIVEEARQVAKERAR